MGNRLKVGRERSRRRQRRLPALRSPALPPCFGIRPTLTETADLAATLNAIIAPVVTELGFELVRIQLTGKPGDMTLQVMAEDPATGQLTLAECARISRALDLPLEEADPIESEYALEVSSPGIDRPLTRRRDWQNWSGHEVRLKLDPAVDGRARAHGVIGAVENDMVSIDIKSVGPILLPLAAIQSAKLVLTPKLLKATRPIDASGADELVELPDDIDEIATDEPASNDNDATED
jgi:ribosome maturation factor RimP